MDKVQSENQFPKIRCAGKYAEDPLYLKYHDEEWGRPLHDEKMLYEMFVIELFQAGLSWRTLLHKRKNFEAAYDGFDLEKVAEYGEEKIEALMQDEGIIRSLPKIRGSIINSRIIRDEILPEYGSWDAYVWSFTGGRTVYEPLGTVTNQYSDAMSEDLKRRGAKYAGSVSIFSYFQAVGVINSHSKECFCYKELEEQPQLYHLTVNFMQTPMGVEKDRICFSWKMCAGKKCVEQEAYQISLKCAGEEIWNSGKVISTRSVGIASGEISLKAGTRYTWQVTVWMKDGACVTSAETCFETAISGDAAWEKAPFLGAKDITLPVLVLTKELKKERVVRARLYATAIGTYQVFLGGREVGSEYHMKPGYGDGARSISSQTFPVEQFLKDGRFTIAFLIGTGWHDKDGADKMAETANQTGIKMLLRIEYADGTRQDITSAEQDWVAVPDGPVEKSGIYYGEDYHQGKYISLKNMLQTGSMEDRTILSGDSLIQFEYVGKIKGEPAGNGRINPEYSHIPKSLTAYSGYRKKSEYPGGEIAEDFYLDNWEENHPVHLKKGQTLIADMGQNMTAIPYLVWKGKKGGSARLRFGEMLNDGSRVTEQFVSGTRDASGPRGTLYTHSLRNARSAVNYQFGSSAKECYQTHTSFFGYRYIEVTADCDIEIYELKSLALSSIYRQNGKIETNHPGINRLFQNILYGQMSNFFTMITDCPQRDERKAWTGDAQVFADSALYNFDAQAFMREYEEKLGAATRQYGYAPAVLSLWDFFSNWASGWSDALIIICYRLYEHSGDTAVIRKHWEEMNRYMEYLKQHERAGHQAPNQDTTGYGDWLAFQGTGYELMADLMYAYVTKLMKKMADLIGEKEKSLYYEKRFEQIKETYLRSHVEKKDGLVVRSDRGTPVMQNKGGVNEKNSQTALLWMLKLGITDGEEMTQELKKLLVENVRNDHPDKESVRAGYTKNSLAVGFLGVPVILPVLTEIGEGTLAYRVLLNESCPSWLFEVNASATTIWERWDSYHPEKGFGDSEMNSYNHFSYGAVAEWMYRYMAGISSEDGFKHIILQPCIDMEETENAIRMVRGEYDSVYGPVRVLWKREKMLEYHVEIPANTSAVLYLPDGEYDVDEMVKDCGKVWHQSAYKRKFTFGSGEYTINEKTNQ